MKNVFSRIAILASIIVLGACGTVPGPFVGLGSDVMSMIIIYRTDDQPLTLPQYEATTKIAQKMGIRIGWQLSSAFESGVVTGAAYYGAGALGGATQGFFYKGALVGAAAGYTGAVYGLGGVINGVMSASYANIHAVSQATELAIRDAEKYDGMNIFKRIHVVGAFIRSKNTAGEPASGLKKQMPEFTGPKVGTPVK
ncbi:MAG: hypothetical protein Q8P17_01805 [bacterium]|nr:hypothetical protein [bacterium]